jgi:hypothetical protein
MSCTWATGVFGWVLVVVLAVRLAVGLRVAVLRVAGLRAVVRRVAGLRAVEVVFVVAALLVPLVP